MTAFVLRLLGSVSCALSSSTIVLCDGCVWLFLICLFRPCDVVAVHEQGFAGWHITSAKRGDNIDTAMTSLVEHALEVGIGNATR